MLKKLGGGRYVHLIPSCWCALLFKCLESKDSFMRECFPSCVRDEGVFSLTSKVSLPPVGYNYVRVYGTPSILQSQWW